jgi:O-antigen ligase
MKKHISDLFIGAWCLYYLQGTLYESGSIISQGLMLLLIVVSLYYFLYANSQYKLPKALKALNILVIVFTIYGTINILFGNGVSYVANYTYLKAIYMSLLPVYPFYVFTKKGLLTEKSLRLWVFVFIPVAIASFYREQREALIEAASLRSTREEFTNNAGYIVLSIIPSIVIWHKKPLIQYGLLAFCMAFVLMGMKRGAILVGGISVLYFVFSSFSGQSSKTRIRYLILAACLVVLGYYVVMRMLATSDYFVYRIEQTQEGNSSGRDVLYLSLLDYVFNKTNVFSFLFGSGADATLRIAEYAHNDWLEIAVNNGIVGAILYLFYWYQMYKTFRKSKNDVRKRMLGLFVIIYSIKSLFSMSYNDITIYASIALGFALANDEGIIIRKND